MTFKYKTVSGIAEFNWTVQLPEATCRESVATDDPAVEAATAAISRNFQLFLWGEDKDPALVYCDIQECDVTIEEDERKQ